MAAARAKIAVKRAYEKPEDSDGIRVLVDRLWPRGLNKANARIDVWLRDLAPSNELRKWAHANPERWPEFRKRYFGELQAGSAAEPLKRIEEMMRKASRITLIFASKNLEHNNALALKEWIERSKRA